MKSGTVSVLFKNLSKFVVKYSPEILIGIGVSGMITSTVLAVKATPKAMDIIQEEKHRRKNECPKGQKPEPMTNWDMAKVTAKCYLPSVIVGLASTVCILSSNSVKTARNAALVTACKASETACKMSDKALEDYKEATINEVGEESEKSIREKVLKKQIEEAAFPTGVVPNDGEVLCYEPIFGNLFYCTRDNLYRGVAEMNRRLPYEDYVSMNDLLYEWELKTPLPVAGKYFGWNVMDMQHENIELAFDSMVVNGNQACLIADFRPRPSCNFIKDDREAL